MNEPIERINHIMMVENVSSYNKFAKLIGISSPQVFYDFKSGKVKSISGDLGSKIIKAYPRYSLLWIIEGAGSPIIGEIKDDELIDIDDSAEFNLRDNLIPMYNFPVAAGAFDTYSNPDDVRIVGHLNIPGAHKEAIAIPAYGDSMYPTLSNGDWAVSRPISDPTEIVWGELYYIEWSDYKMYKRLLHADEQDEVILWSDNQLEMIGTRPKFAQMLIKKESIRKLRLVTEILKKPNF